MRHSAIIFAMMSPVFTSFGQNQGRATSPLLLEGANFFVCIVAGILLAVGFQLMLTMLSIAGGITAVGDLKKQGETHNSKSYDKEEEHGMNIGQKISTALGAWTMITTSVALFFASLLAVKLGLVGANFIGATLGLVIWAGFFILMTYLEMSAVSSLIGGMVSTAKHSLSSVFSTFSRSEAGIAKDVAKTNARAQAKEMRKQFEKLFNTHDIDKKVANYIQELKPQKVDIHQLKKEIRDLITHLQVTEKVDPDYPMVKKMILEEADKSTLSKEQKQAIKEHVTNLKEIAKQDVSPEEKTKRGIEDLTHTDRERIDKYQDQIKKILRNTNKEELQPEKLEQDLKRVLNEPGQASNIAKAKASAIDRNTLVKIIASRNMEEEEAEDYLNKIETALQRVSSFFGNTGDRASHTTHNLQARVKNIFSGTGTSLSMDRIYSDFTSIFQASAEGPDLKYKLQHYNKEEMITFITSKTSLSRTEAEPIAEKIVSARDTVVQRADEIEAKINEKMAEAKEKTLIAAEESRKAAVNAAWWLVGTAILSGAASAVGGMLALEGWFF